MTRSTRKMLKLWSLAFGALAAQACNGDSEIAVGSLERDRIELVAEANEPIAEIAVREGDAVAAGALVVRLAPERLHALRDAAEQRVASAQARLAELERGPRREQIAQARARLAGASDAFATAEREATRAATLHDAGAASDEFADQRARALSLARSERDAARAALDELLAGTRIEQLAQARAQLEEARAAAREAELREQRLEVRAPSAAVVDALPYEVGERPPAGAVVAVLLADGAPYARVYVPAALRARVAPGSAARVRVDGVDGELAARVRSVSQEASFTPYFALTQHDRGRLSYVAELDLTEASARDLPSGLPVEVEFDGGASAR
ncbi:MAG TPA: HlyD family efflux transporter periplasmic adaptor subunit [Myxococcota bacterium]